MVVDVIIFILSNLRVRKLVFVKGNVMITELDYSDSNVDMVLNLTPVLRFHQTMANITRLLPYKIVFLENLSHMICSDLVVQENYSGILRLVKET